MHTKGKQKKEEREGMREIERLEQENERLYKEKATVAKQMKLLKIKLGEYLEKIKSCSTGYQKGDKQ